jgi:hypothetical protein
MGIDNQNTFVGYDYIDKISMPRKDSTSFSTESFVYEIVSKIDEVSDFTSYRIALDQLCKKIDVNKKIFVFYQGDQFTSVEGSLLDVNYEFLLLSILLMFADRFNDFKYLNSSFKLIDILQKRGLKVNQEYIDYADDLLQKISMEGRNSSENN